MTPDHAIPSHATPDEIVLGKNPFYVEFFRTLAGGSNQVQVLAIHVTLGLGYLDEILDVIEDATLDKPNGILRLWDLQQAAPERL